MRLVRIASEAVLLFVVSASIWGCAALKSGAAGGALSAATDTPLPGAPPGLNFWEWLAFTVATGVAYGGVSAVKGAIRTKFFNQAPKA